MEAGRQLEPGFCINKELFFKPFENITKIKSFCMFFIRLFRFREHICPINLHSEKLFQFTQIFIGCHLRFFRVASNQIFFQGGSLKKVRCHTYKSEKKSGERPEKNLGRCYSKKSQVAPYENLCRFYRVPFKSLLRVQIKWVII